MLRSATALTASLLFAFSLAIASRADEGLWTFDNFPTGKVKAAYGVDIDQAWLKHVMGAEVRLSNRCSASVVSSTGLVLTANHCISECAQGVSGLAKDNYDDGFIAENNQEEKRCSGLTAEILLSITDVTTKVLDSEVGLTGDALVKAHLAGVTQLEKEGCSDRSKTRCQVVELYRGGQYKLYRYRQYDDVRLVFSPGVAASAFGGDTFPPFTFDGAFLRLYNHDAPEKTPDHLKWSLAAPRAGELVLLAGNPNRSERELTLDQLQTQRGFSLPYTLVQSAELIGRLKRFGEESEDNSRSSHYQLDDLQNYYSYALVRLMALNDEAFFARKKTQESDLRSKVGPDIQAEWAKIAEAETARRKLELAYDDLEGGPSLSGAPASELFSYARTLVRGATERQKPSAQRMQGYTDSELSLTESNLFQEKAVYKPFEQLELNDWLSRTQEYLPADDPYAIVLLEGQDPAALSSTLAQCKLGDVALRRQLWAGGLAAVRASTDPMIRYVLRIEPAARALDVEWAKLVTQPEADAAGAIARAEFKVYGANIYPDASRSLRLSFGRISGLTADGKLGSPFSTFGGLYKHATGRAPDIVSPKWLMAENKLNPASVLDMLTTDDAINGNSGSPILNAKAEVIGVFGGGNDAAEAGDYYYDQEFNRAYGLTTAAMTEALGAVYGDRSLQRELEGAGP